MIRKQIKIEQFRDHKELASRRTHSGPLSQAGTTTRI